MIGMRTADRRLNWCVLCVVRSTKTSHAFHFDKYRADGSIHLIGVEFSRGSRSIVGFERQTLAMDGA